MGAIEEPEGGLVRESTGYGLWRGVSRAVACALVLADGFATAIPDLRRLLHLESEGYHEIGLVANGSEAEAVFKSDVHGGRCCVVAPQPATLFAICMHGSIGPYPDNP